jgi:N-acetylglucosamine repressor
MSPRQKSDRVLMKQMNQQLVLQLIQGRGPISRSEITQISGLSPASVSGITSTLIDLGLVHEVGEVEGTGRAGRRAVLLRLNPHAGFVIGVKLAMTAITCVLTDLDANVLHTHVQPLPPPDPVVAPFDPHATIQTTIAAIEDLLRMAQIEPDRLMGIGVGVNGTVDADAGISCVAPHFGWRNVPIAAPLAKHFGIPVSLENDARALTIAEQWFGAGREVDHFVTVVIGYGIGAGVVTNGQLYRGSSSGAGEFGHMVLQQDGPVCSCGKRGCLEALAGIPAILRDIEAALVAGEPSLLPQGEAPTFEAIAEAAEKGDELALRVLQAAGRWLGYGMVCLVNVLNPELIVLNGEALRLGQAYLGPMEAVLREQAFAGMGQSLRIIIEPSGNEVWARGAACVVLSSLFISVEQRQRSRPLQAAA